MRPSGTSPGLLPAGTARLRARLLPGDPTQPPSVAYAVPRAVGGAVERNRLRRRLRATVRELDAELVPGGRYLLSAGPAAMTTTTVELRDTLRALLRATRERADERAGLRPGERHDARRAPSPLARRLGRGQAHPGLPAPDVAGASRTAGSPRRARSTRSRPSRSTARSAARGSRSGASVGATRGTPAGSTQSLRRTPVRMRPEAGS